MQVRRVAVIFDDRERPETTGVYCRRALESMVETVHFRPNELAGMARTGFDLYLSIDDGFEYQLPDELRPSAWWAIDTHLNIEWCERKAQAFDFVFAAQRDGADRLEADWLPLACDPDVHQRFDVDKLYDLAFVGNIFPGPRADLVGLLQRRFRSMYVGRAYFDEMARIYSAARMTFNRSLKNDINMRVFEAIACGSLLLTNELTDNGQAELFRDGVHLATYRDADELLDKTTYYLAHEATRERIEAAGRAEALAKHTYRHRMQTLLDRVSQGERRSAKRRTAPTNTANLSGYYEFVRPELLALVPNSAKCVLDVGCGAGRLGEAIKARQGAKVVGLEFVPAAAQQARGRLDEVFEGDLEKLELPFEEGGFDCVICGDVLEHLREPARFLYQVRRWLKPDACVVASVPNVRHHSVVSALLEGNWSYEPAGLLDETHLRFFTRRDIVDLFECAGFHVAEFRVVPGPGYDEWRKRGCPGEVQVGRLHIADMTPGEAEEFFVYQYLLVATPRGSTADVPQSTLNTPPETSASATVPGELGTGHNGERSLRIAFLGNFEQAWSTEGYAAEALERVGHTVHRIHEYGVRDADEVLRQIQDFRAQCLLFFKGRIGVDPNDVQAVLRPDPTQLIDVLRRSPVPAYLWYYDRVHEYHADPGRLEWMRRVAPLCRVAFVTDGGLASTGWANWHILRQGISVPTITQVDVSEAQREDVAFVGQIYGPRRDELETIRSQFKLNVVSNIFGKDLSSVIRGHRIIVGPGYPSAPGYWSDRIYVVLGHGGFFLAPEVDGMRKEGFDPGVHFAALGRDPVRDIHYWLGRPVERARIARQGQELVLNRFTYEHRVTELCSKIAATLDRDNSGAGLSRDRKPVSPSARRSTDTRRLRFRHRRKLGDVIYSLPAMRQLGGGVLYLDPDSLDGTQDQIYWREKFKTLIPFLEQQPYIDEVRIRDQEPFDIDLDAYLRTTHGTPGDRITITANHFIGLGLDVPDAIAPWLTARNPSMTYPIVIHRSHHYHGAVDYSFLLDVREKLYCVGSAEERRPFEAIGARPLVTNDVRELAEVINGCGVFIGNQSLPLAIAAGLGKPRMIEESDRLPNCDFGSQAEFLLTRSTSDNRDGLLRLLEKFGCPSAAYPEVAMTAGA